MNDWSKRHGGSRAFLALSRSFPDPTGYNVRSHSIATHLLAHGVDLSVYTRPGFPLFERNAPMDFEYDGVIYHRLPHLAPETGYSGVFYREMAREVYRQAIRESRACIVHAASDKENGLPAVIAGKDLGARTIYEYRGMWHYTRDSHVPWHHITADYSNSHALELEVGTKADAVFTISEALREDLVSYGLDRNKISILPNAVDVERFSPQPRDEQLRSELGLQGKVVGFVGSITRYEGIDYLIDAVLSLNAAGEKVSLLVVGDGHNLAYLREHHRVRGSHPCVVFAGRVPFDEINRYYSIIDIIALPRVNCKVCQCIPPLKPLEAMAMGKGLIVSDMAAMCEIVKHDQTGLVCRSNSVNSLAEQLGRLISEPELFRVLTENAMDWVRQERDWAIVSKRILQVYEKLIG